MIRRNYQAWSHSPLTQINATNVKDLQLVWAWAMNEGGANEPTPIVHNGIMFLANTGNIVQALDARTGELIWENRIGPGISGGLGAMRSLALYQDKVYFATTDAHLVALDARTGKTSGKPASPITAKGYSNTSGPIVINGKVIQGMGGCDRYKETGCFISAYDAQTGKQLWKFDTVARAAHPGGDTWGKLAEPAARRRRHLDHRQLRSGSESDLLGRGAGQAVDARHPRHQRRRAVHQFDARAESRRRKTGLVFPARARRIAGSGTVYERVLVDSGGAKLAVHHRQGRHPVEARSQDRQVSRLQGNRLSERFRQHR